MKGLNCLKKCDFDHLNLTQEGNKSDETAEYSHALEIEDEKYAASFASLSIRKSRSENADNRQVSKEKERLVPPLSLPPLIQALVGNLDDRPVQKKRGSKVIGPKVLGLPGSTVRRMKYYKEEWEEALRWISKWSQQQYHDVDMNYTKGELSSRQTRKESSKGQLKKNSVQKCLDRCQRKYSLSLSDEIQYDHVSKFNGEDIQISLLQFASIRYHAFLRAHVESLRSMFGVFFSMVVVLVIKNVSDWWKLNRYTLSLQELLLEESKTKSSSTLQPGKVKKGKPKTSRHGKNGRLRARFQNSESTEDDCPDSDDSEDDSIERLYVLNSKNRSSVTKIPASKIVRSSVSSTNQQDPPKEKYLKETCKMERKPEKKKSSIKNSNKNQIKESSNKYFSESELDQFVCKMALYQSRQIMRILKDEILCERAGKLSHLLLSDLHKYYQIKDTITATSTNIPIKTPNRSPPGFVQDAEIMMKSNAPRLGKEMLEETEVNLMLSNILDESDDDADKTWASSTSNSTKPDSFPQSKIASRSVAIGDLLLGSLGNDVNSSPKSTNPWNMEMTSTHNVSNESLEHSSASQLLLWGDGGSTKIW